MPATLGKLLSNGATVKALHPHENDKHLYTLVVENPKFTFPNVSIDHLLKSFGSKITFDQSMMMGGVILDLHKTHNYFSAHVKLPNGTIHTFSNLSQDHLAKHVNIADFHHFDDCIKMGGQLVKLHESHSGHYSAHLKLVDGSVRVFNNVAKAHLVHAVGEDSFERCL